MSARVKIDTSVATCRDYVGSMTLNEWVESRMVRHEELYGVKPNRQERRVMRATAVAWYRKAHGTPRPRVLV